jgi:hypothetical protein
VRCRPSRPNARRCRPSPADSGRPGGLPRWDSATRDRPGGRLPEPCSGLRRSSRLSPCRLLRPRTRLARPVAHIRGRSLLAVALRVTKRSPPLPREGRQTHLPEPLPVRPWIDSRTRDPFSAERWSLTVASKQSFRALWAPPHPGGKGEKVFCNSNPKGRNRPGACALSGRSGRFACLWRCRPMWVGRARTIRHRPSSQRPTRSNRCFTTRTLPSAHRRELWTTSAAASRQRWPRPTAASSPRASCFLRPWFFGARLPAPTCLAGHSPCGLLCAA